jgi:hypothetical protein
MGLFEGDATPNSAFAELRHALSPKATSASLLTLTIKIKAKAVSPFRMVAKHELRSPDTELCGLS